MRRLSAWQQQSPAPRYLQKSCQAFFRFRLAALRSYYIGLPGRLLKATAPRGRFLQFAPLDAEPGQIFPQAVGVVCASLASARSSKEGASGVGEGARAPADAEHGSKLDAIEVIELLGALTAKHLFDLVVIASRRFGSPSGSKAVDSPRDDF